MFRCLRNGKFECVTELLNLLNSSWKFHPSLGQYVDSKRNSFSKTDKEKDLPTLLEMLIASYLSYNDRFLIVGKIKQRCIELSSVRFTWRFCEGQVSEI